jgi:hypothetical protein
MNASNLYYKSLQKVQEELENKSFSKPVFVTISEDDSVIKAEEIVSIFLNNFKNPNSQLLWFGKKIVRMTTELLLYHLIFQKNILVIFPIYQYYLKRIISFMEEMAHIECSKMVKIRFKMKKKMNFGIQLGD